jgi:inner membrane protein
VPTVFTHAVAGAALGAAFWRPEVPARVWVAGAVCAALPDVDALGLYAGIPYGHVLGHRGLTHSLPFAAALAALAAVALAPTVAELPRALLWLYLFLATASHGVLDALTNGGLGVAFLAPFSDARYFFPTRPIAVSPIGVRALLSPRGLAALASEVRWVWLPSVAFALLALAARKWWLAGAPRPA